MATQQGNPWALRHKPQVWQEGSLRIWSAEQRGPVSLVTNEGKTVFAEITMLAFCQQYSTGRRIVLVPLTTLLDPWSGSLKDDLAVPKEEIACYSNLGRSPQPHPRNRTSKRVTAAPKCVSL